MVRFFFHLHCAAQSITDCQGVVLKDAGAAHDEARRVAADFIDRASGQPFPKWRDWRIEVSDARGRRVFALPLEEFAGAGLVAAKTSGSTPERVVHLDIVRNARALTALRNRARDLIREAAVLRDEHKFIRRRFDVESRALLAAVGGGRGQAVR
jgi:hypothetical protein